MGWMNPNHICGHSGPRYQSYGPHDRRKRRHAAMESQPCSECRAKNAAEKDGASGLPALKGSPKQVAWASDVREGLLAEWERQIEAAEKLCVRVKADERSMAEDTVVCARRRLAERREQNEAKWWIENRDAKSPLLEEALVRREAMSSLRLVGGRQDNDSQQNEKENANG